MTKRNSNLMEGIGLILILFSFFVQMIESGIENDIRETQNYQIHKKLDYIWRITSQDYAQRYPEEDVHSSINFKHYFNDYTIYSEDYNELDAWQKLVKYDWFTNVRLLLFIVGSIMLIVPKFTKNK